MTVAGASQVSPFRRFTQSPLLARLQQRGPTVAVVVLAAIIAWQLAGLIWHLFPERADSDIPFQRSALNINNQGSSNPTTRGVNVAGVVNAHLFGVADAEQVPEAIVDETIEAPETNLPLKLRGTLAASSDTEALAIIADGREENVFRLKDAIRNGVTLHAVQTTQVILNRGGVLEALKLPQPDETVARTPQRPAVRTRLTPATPSVTQVLTTNASQFTQIIQPRPYFVGGQQRGYRLYPGSDRKQFASLGLRPGDIVTEINGSPLNNPTQGAQIFSQLGDAQSITVTLERGGEQQTLTLDTSQLDIANQASK